MSPQKQPYNKLPLTYQEQIALMESRGLTVPDHSRAERYLSQISYYRLSAYMLPFKQVKDTFNTGTTFDQIIDLYVFDRELRLLAFDAIERVEVTIRAQMIYQLAHKYGSHWPDKHYIFKDQKTFGDIQKIIKDHCASRNPEVFIEHYLHTYDPPATPPSWMSIELLTVGQLSLLYKAINKNEDRKDIAAYFSLHHNVFQSWLHAITYVRNICAHHARLWNRDFAIQPDLLLKPALPWINPSFKNNRRAYYFFCCLQYLLKTANPSSHFKQKLVDLTTKHPNIPIQYAGFTKKWETEPIWAK